MHPHAGMHFELFGLDFTPLWENGGGTLFCNCCGRIDKLVEPL